MVVRNPVESPPVRVYTPAVDLPTPSFYSRLGKRSFDILVAGFVTVFILSWMMPIVGIAIWLNSRGPILFLQKRTGYRGRVFTCLKFRTMYHNPNNRFSQAKPDDARITSLGRFLRQTNIDEMPQFINVLLGQMSVVGPRPHPTEMDSYYWWQLSDYQKRYSVRPGITGLAQARGARGETDHLRKMQHRIKYDLMYITKKSLLFDIRICWWTIKAMIRGDVNAW